MREVLAGKREAGREGPKVSTIRALVPGTARRWSRETFELEGGEMPEECRNHRANLEMCNCTYEPCSRKGYCCECLHYHRRNGELPACFFPPEVERTYDRSVSRFLKSR